MQISLMDVPSVYFNAKLGPGDLTYVQLPDEDKGSETKCGRLVRHMYGTHAAADGWQEECSTALVRMGFVQGLASPNVLRHEEKKISCSVHGDDFTSGEQSSTLPSLTRLGRRLTARTQVGRMNKLQRRGCRTTISTAANSKSATPASRLLTTSTCLTCHVLKTNRYTPPV